MNTKLNFSCQKSRLFRVLPKSQKLRGRTVDSRESNGPNRLNAKKGGGHMDIGSGTRPIRKDTHLQTKNAYILQTDEYHFLPKLHHLHHHLKHNSRSIVNMYCRCAWSFATVAWATTTQTRHAQWMLLQMTLTHVLRSVTSIQRFAITIKQSLK